MYPKCQGRLYEIISFKFRFSSGLNQFFKSGQPPEPTTIGPNLNLNLNWTSTVLTLTSLSAIRLSSSVHPHPAHWLWLPHAYPCPPAPILILITIKAVHDAQLALATSTYVTTTSSTFHLHLAHWPPSPPSHQFHHLLSFHFCCCSLHCQSDLTHVCCHHSLIVLTDKHPR